MCDNLKDKEYKSYSDTSCLAYIITLRTQYAENISIRTIEKGLFRLAFSREENLSFLLVKRYTPLFLWF